MRKATRKQLVFRVLRGWLPINVRYVMGLSDYRYRRRILPRRPTHKPRKNEVSKPIDADTLSRQGGRSMRSAFVIVQKYGAQWDFKHHKTVK